ncbi:MAG: phosphoribosylaminoimidazolesuccinocarboxamide synthase [Chitinophagaceae bacterium]
MHFNHQTAFYQGKVRDVYSIGNELLLMVASNRISAFDVILPRPIPYKGQILNQIASKFLDATSDIVPNWKLSTPLPHITLGKRCQPFAIEMVIRGNLTGHAWRTYKQGLRMLCGEKLPEGMQEHDFFAQPIITPSTKAHHGHDEDISKEDIIKQNIVSEEDYAAIERITHQLFKRGQEMAHTRGLILVDTKYEFGKIGNTIFLMDEIHTPDSSRYFYKEGFEERQQKGAHQKQLSKEFVREWLIENGFQGKEGQQIPTMDDEKILAISQRYVELYEHITGEKFVPHQVDEEQTMQQVNTEIEKYMHL